MADVKQIVESAIADNTIAVFSKTWCGYCAAAKQLLKATYGDVPTVILELDEREDGDDIQAYLQKKTGQRTVPNIFINQKHIGGSDDLRSLKSRGKLDDIVAGKAN